MVSKYEKVTLLWIHSKLLSVFFLALQMMMSACIYVSNGPTISYLHVDAFDGVNDKSKAALLCKTAIKTSPESGTP